MYPLVVWTTRTAFTLTFAGLLSLVTVSFPVSTSHFNKHFWSVMDNEKFQVETLKEAHGVQEDNWVLEYRFPVTEDASREKDVSRVPVEKAAPPPQPHPRQLQPGRSRTETDE